MLVAPGSNVGAGAGLAVIRSAEGAAVRAESVAAGAEAEAARAALAREERLFKAGVTARQDFEAARAASARASAEAVSARAKVAAAGGPGVSGETFVRSPIAGIVTGLQVAPGGFVSQGGAVAEVANPAQVEVVFNAPAEAAASGLLLATDVADYLVGRGVPFRTAHEIVGGLVRKLVAEGRDFASLSLAEWRAASDRFEAEIGRAHV